MSVRTTADEKIDVAKEHIQSAIECLSEVVINRCYGTDEYASTHISNLRRQLINLLYVREVLE